jgi:hypothetical protein
MALAALVAILEPKSPNYSADPYNGPHNGYCPPQNHEIIMYYCSARDWERSGLLEGIPRAVVQISALL